MIEKENNIENKLGVYMAAVIILMLIFNLGKYIMRNLKKENLQKNL